MKLLRWGSAPTRRRLLGALIMAGASACASWPADRAERALYIDLAKAVELSNDTGWVVDRVQLESNAEDALLSVCQVTPEKRAGLAAWIDAELARAGGSAERVYREHGRDRGAASDALQLERVRALLRYADQHAASDCPFWLEPEPTFRGMQGDESRLVLWAETVGYGSLVLERDNAAIGGGGGGRVLFGYGLGPQLTLAIGGEIGGAGAFIENDRNTRTIETTFSAAVPVVLRMSKLSRVIDLELGPIVRINPDRDLFPPGVRGALAVGFTTMRSSSFMPYALLWLGYEYHPPQPGNAQDHSLHIGTRVGVDWDP